MSIEDPFQTCDSCRPRDLGDQIDREGLSRLLEECKRGYVGIYARDSLCRVIISRCLPLVPEIHGGGCMKNMPLYLFFWRALVPEDQVCLYRKPTAVWYFVPRGN